VLSTSHSRDCILQRTWPLTQYPQCAVHSAWRHRVWTVQEVGALLYC